MTLKIEINQQIIRTLIEYNPDTGVVIWKRRDPSHFKTERSCKIWNTRHAEKPAGRVSFTNKNYKTKIIRIFGKDYYTHRIIWMYFYGDQIPAQIDHINHDATDNRIDNLRDGTTINHLNRSMHTKNTSGVSGVHYCKRSKKWIASCSINNVRKPIGSFSSIEEASSVVVSYRKSVGFTETHGKSKNV